VQRKVLIYKKYLKICENILKYHRWHNHLNPRIKKDKWTLEEELKLIEIHKIYGNKWSLISKYL